MRPLLKFILGAVFLVAACTCNTAFATEQSLKIALVHFKVAYGEHVLNLDALKQLHRDAAAKGAKLILNTELALSGYSFSSRADIRPLTQTKDSKALREIAELAKELSVYIGITFPERDPETDSFYNAAAVFSPQGEMVCKYHKIYGEKRWARAGSPYQKNVFQTPWGRIGVAICADSYFGLIPRTLALKGADLIWVPANWPPTGLLSPLDVWQTRAMENGVYLAACNRTGKDRTMDCSKAVTAVIAPNGTPMFSRSSETSALFFADIPLDNNGKIKNILRRERMADRKIGLYRKLYLDPWTENLTQYYQLPPPGKITIHCLTSQSGHPDMKTIVEHVTTHSATGSTLWVLPQTEPDKLDMEKLKELARTQNCAFALSLVGEDKQRAALLITGNGTTSFTTEEGGFPFRLLHFGPATVAMVPMAELHHPELGIVLAKLGCDIVVVSESTLSEADARLAFVRTIDNLAVVAAGGNRAVIAHMKGVHGQMSVKKAVKGGFCSFELDTAETRKKTFYDRVDFDLLLTNRKGEY